MKKDSKPKKETQWYGGLISIYYSQSADVVINNNQTKAMLCPKFYQPLRDITENNVILIHRILVIDKHFL